MPDYLIRRLQKVENAAAGFVQGRYANAENVLALNWLPVKERILLHEYRDLFIDMAVRNNRSKLAIANRHQER